MAVLLAVAAGNTKRLLDASTQPLPEPPLPEPLPLLTGGLPSVGRWPQTGGGECRRIPWIRPRTQNHGPGRMGEYPFD